MYNIGVRLESAKKVSQFQRYGIKKALDALSIVSVMKQIKSKNRNRLAHETLDNGSNLQQLTYWETIVSEKPRPQASH